MSHALRRTLRVPHATLLFQVPAERADSAVVMAALTGKAAALCLLFFGSAFFFGGIALLSAGNAAASSADELSPTTDFETLGSVCEIVNVAHSAREDSRTESSRSGSRSSSRTSRTVYECYDDYT